MSKSNRYKERKVADPSVSQPKFQKYSKDVDLNKFHAIVAFFPPLFWWPLVRCPDSKFGRECANQGLILLLMAVAGGLIVWLLSLITDAMLGEFYYYELVGYVILTLEIAFMFNGFLSTYDGRVAKVPLLGRMKLLK